MIWPEFNGDLLIGAVEPLYHLLLQEKIYKPVLETEIELSLGLFEKDELIPEGGFIVFSGWYHIFVDNHFLDAHFQNKSNSYDVFMSGLKDIYAMSANIYNGEDKATVRSAMFTFYFSNSAGQIAMCQVHNEFLEVLLQRTEELFGTMLSLNNGEDIQVITELDKSYQFKDNVYYLSYQTDKWVIIDPLLYVAEGINQSYIQNTDDRVNKPDIILHEENLNKKYTFGDNWVLNFDGLSTLMARPNDVSIYASICEKNLVAAKRFYNDTILPRHQYHHGPFPSIEQQREYFDYFELITTSLIFSFTAIEAFVNSIIPDQYKFITSVNTIHDKAYIERSYPLTKKLTRVLTDLLTTPDPKAEVWWVNLEALQNLRDQTIHTKQSFSEERYSHLLQQDIFELIGTYKIVINYYGRYIKQNSFELINNVPYGFGFNEVNPLLMSDETYRKIYNDLHNPLNPL